jgi:magnesium-protoporphyrin IX monomethyl ester (oxidative) cyclase
MLAFIVGLGNESAQIGEDQMLRVAFVNMPFADWNRPSIALGQLSTVLRRKFGGQVSTEIHYLNLDVAEYVGIPFYELMSQTHHQVNSGLCDWLFRQLAFPELKDNSDEYLGRFYPGRNWAELRDRITALRPGLRDLCDSLIGRYRLAEADIVGFSSMFAQHVPSIALARMIKERNPDVVTVIGGANCEAPMSAAITEHVSGVDYLFSGPSLDTFPAFVGHVLAGDVGALDSIRGVVSRRNCRDDRYGTAVGSDHDIDDVILPEYDSFLHALDAHEELCGSGLQEPMLFFETSRGCWWGQRSHCTFCGLNGESIGYRAMRPEPAKEQFDWLFEFAPKYKRLFCTDNVMPRNYPRDVFAQLDPPAGVSIFYEVKLPLSRQDLGRMVAGGVTQVQPGIESLATSTLKLMAKGTTAFHNLQFLKNCDEFGIDPVWNLLIGFPGESEEVYQRYMEVLPRLTHLRPPGGVFIVRFDRYSPYFTRRDEYGLDLHPMDYYPMVYPFDEDTLDRMAYYFADRSYGRYMIDAITWVSRLEAVIGEWSVSWSGQGPRRELRLTGSDGDGWVIRDSRGGSMTEHPVDAATARLVLELTSPARIDQLSADEEVERRLAWLDEHGMTFDEDGKVLSLVLVDGETGEQDTPTGDRVLLPIVAKGRS